MSAGLFFSFLSIAYAYVGLGLNWDRHWDFVDWTVGLFFTLLPFAFSFWVVYRSYRLEDMDYWTVLGVDIRPVAFMRALRAELCLIVIVVAMWLVAAWIIPRIAMSRAMSPNKSPEPTAVGAGRSAIAVHVAGRRWLSFSR